MEALSLLVSGMPTTVLADMVGDGWSLIKTAVVRSAKDPQVHSHITTILAALFPAWTLPGVQMPRGDSGPAVHADCLVLVANLAAANAAHGNLEAARTASWALACMAVHAAKHPALADGVLSLGHLQQLWVMLTGQVMLIVMDMLANVAQKDNGLAKNCLRYIEVVAGACQRGGHAAAVAACGDGSATQFLRDALQLAASVAKLSTDLRLQVAALRCMRSLLVHPHVFGLLSDDDTLASLLRATSLARFTPGSNPKDVALVQAYGVCVLGSLLTRDNLHTIHHSTATSVAPEAHASLAAVVAFVLEGLQAQASGAVLGWQLEEVAHEAEGVSCRLGSLCLGSHEDISPALVAAMAASCAHILHWCGVAGHAPLGVNCPDGSGVTVLHRLSAAGLTDAVKAFVSAAGPALDLDQQDMTGMKAVDVASHRGHQGVVAVLSTAADAFRADPQGIPLMHAPATVSSLHIATPTAANPNALASPAWPAHVSAITPRSHSLHSEPIQRSSHSASLDPRLAPSLASLGPRATQLAPAPPARSPPDPTISSIGTIDELTGNTNSGSIGGMNAFSGDAGFRVNTAALSQLIGSVVNGGANMSLSSLPPWLSAGVAAAVSAHEEAVASAAAPGGAGQHLRAEDLALIADAEALLSSHRLGSGSSVNGGTAAGNGAPGSVDGYDDGNVDSPNGSGRSASKHLWLGNLSTKLPRSVLKAVFEHFGIVEDVVTFPGRMYAFVNFRNPEDAARAAATLNDREVPPLTGTRRLVVKFRPSKKALGKSADGPGADAAAAAAASAGGQSSPDGDSGDGCPIREAPSKTPSRSSLYSTDCSKGGSLGGAAGPSASGMPSSSRHGGATGRGGSGAVLGSSVLDSSALNTSGSSEEDEVAPQSSSSDGFEGPSHDTNCDGHRHNCNSNQLMASLAGLTSSAGDGDATNLGSSSPDSFTDADEAMFAEGRPSRHLWLGNIPLRPNKQAIEALFSPYGALESVRVFPGKTFAFVNFVDASDAVQAKAVLDGQMASSVTGLKPLAIRFQKDTPSSSPGPGQSCMPAAVTEPSTELSTDGTSNPSEAMGSCTPSGQLNSRPSSISTASLQQQQQQPHNIVAAAASAAGLGPGPAGRQQHQQLQPPSSAVSAVTNKSAFASSPTAMAPPAAMSREAGSVTNSALSSSSASAAAASLAGALLAGRAVVPGLAGLAAATSLSKLLDTEDVPQEPAINLSNRLNPNNVHFDKELAARYKRMTKAEKEALWAQDRMLQQMASSTAAAALLSAAQGMDGGTAALLAGAGLGAGTGLGLGAAGRPLASIPTAQSLGLPNLPELSDLHRLNQLLPRVMSNNTLAAAAAAAQMQASVSAGHNAAAASGLARATSLQSLPALAGAGLLGNSASAAALLQSHLGLLGGAGQNNNATVAAIQLQLLAQQQLKQQQEQRQQQQLAALGLAGIQGATQPAGLNQAQQLQQQLLNLNLGTTDLGLGGNKVLPQATSDALLGLTTSAGVQQPWQLQQQQHQQALLGTLQAQTGMGRNHADLNALMQAQALMQMGGNPAGNSPSLNIAGGNGSYLSVGAHGLTSTIQQNQPQLYDTAAAQLQQLMQLQQEPQQVAPPQHFSATQKQGFPTSFHCPLSGMLMTDPVVAADGVSYQRAAITEWLQSHSNSPITRHALANKFLAPNHSLKAAVFNELTRSQQGMQLPHLG